MKSLFAVFLLFSAVQGFAAAPKSKPKAAATVTGVIGSPKVKQGQADFKKMKLGQSLEPGALIKTGKGKASLLISDGSSVRLGENTDITLQSHNPEEAKGGTVFSLAKGVGRFLVNKLVKGRHFEVRTANAVAAVKGTDWEIGSDGDTSEVKVYESETKGAVEFGDLDGEKRTLIEENEQASFDGNEFKEDTFTPEEQQQAEQSYQGLPEDPQPQEGGQGEGQQEGQDGGQQGQAQPEGEGGEASQASGEEQQATDGEAAGEEEFFAEFAEEAVQDIYAEIYEDIQQDFQEQQNDLETGRVVVDRKGYATQVLHRFSRPYPSAVIKEVSAVREFGPDAGETYAYEFSDWNQDLPFEWSSVASRPVNDPANLDGGGYPIYYRNYQNFFAANPWGDYLQIDTVFDAPHFVGSMGGPVQQGFTQNYYTNGYSRGYIAVRAYDIVGQVSGAGISYNCGSCPPLAKSSMNEADGSVSFHYYDSVSSDTVFDLNISAIDDDGVRTPHLSLFPGGASDPSAYRSLASSPLNIEVSFSSPDFYGGEIDLIFLPGYFNSFDLITFPDSYSGGGAL